MSRKKVLKLRKELRTNVYTFIVSSFGLVAALAWNTAIQDVFNRYYSDTGSIYAKLIYAVVVTLIAVIITFIVSKWVEKE